MRVEDFGTTPSARPWMLKYPLREAPHFTVETNKTCNIRCRSCYSLERSRVKTRGEIQEEISLALAKRRASAVTLLGGEPTLHPDLPAVVADVKARGLRCQLLTNGLKFLESGGDGLLDRLAAAGLDRVLVHMDEGQAHVHPDLDAARRAVFDRLERRGMRFGLSLTVYDGCGGRIPDLLRTYAVYRRFDGILAVLARDPLRPGAPGPGLEAERNAFLEDMEIAPSAYVPSSRDDGDVRWIAYFLFLNVRTGRALALPPRPFGLAARAYRAARGRRLFVPFPSRTAVLPLALAAAGAGVLSWTASLKEAASVFKRSRRGRDLRFLFAVVQTPPEFRDEGRTYVLCHACPDATVRNGRLTPVCVADLISPFDGAAPQDCEADHVRRRAAYGHLGEL